MQNPFIPPSGSSGPLFPYFSPYLTLLKKPGYAVGSLYEQVHVLKVYDRWLKRIGREVRDLDESVTCECLRHAIKGGYGKNAGASTLRRLLKMLREIGVTPEAKAARLSPSEQLTHGYHAERNHQGLGNKIIRPEFAESSSKAAINSRKRLGGLLRYCYYYREAA
jgi:hypothetical protein